MSHEFFPQPPPTKILLATDLSPGSDRALDRASQLARQWNAELLIVHAIESGQPILSGRDDLPSWRRPPIPRLSVERQIRRDLRDEVNNFTVHVEEGDPTQVILEAAEREACDLVILGSPRSELFGRLLYRSTVEQLVRKSPISVLVVKTRPNGPYKHVLVGTDFTDESRYGLQVASSYLPESQMTVMHAFDLPYRSLLSDSALSSDFAAMETATIREFVNEAVVGAPDRARIRTLIEHGPPDLMLSRYVDEKHADLTVIGAYGRGRLFHLLVGGHTPRIMDTVPSDVLLIRAQRGQLPTPAEE